MEEFERACCIRGYHEYKEVWEAAVGEELVLFVVENISRVLFSCLYEKILTAKICQTTVVSCQWVEGLGTRLTK